MASLYARKNSPFWYLEYRDKDGNYRNRSTGLRRSDPGQTQEAGKLRAEAEVNEFHRAISRRGHWDWVDPYLVRKCQSSLTLLRYRTAWGWLHQWLTESKLTPQDIHYSHAAQYVAWRVSYRKHSGKKAGQNTAIMEAKILSMIMAEGVRLEHLRANPWSNLEMARVEAPKKRELTSTEIELCRKALKNEDEWMQLAFEIGLQTGCRLRETIIPLRCIDLDAAVPTMTFPSPKGGTGKAFSIPIPAGLMELFKQLKADGRTVTLEMPFQPSRHWSRFFKSLKLDDVCFHCLRVTRVTQLRRAGVPREAAMRLVNHSSELIHMLYDRHQVQDLAQWVDKGQATGPLVSAATAPNPTKKRGPQKREKSADSKRGKPNGKNSR